MSTTAMLAPTDMPREPERPKRSRFAGERLGAWLFAASFSIGIWGLALKILSPTHPTPDPVSALHYATLEPSGAADGRATVVWGPETSDFATGFPPMDGVPVTTLNPSDGPNSPRN